MAADFGRARAAALAGLLALVGVVGCAGKPPLHARPERQAPPAPPPVQGLAPRVISVPDERPRPPGLRLLAQQHFTINVQDGELAAILLGLGRESPLNIVVEPGVEGRVTADLEDVTLLQILDQIVRPRGFHWDVRGNLLRIFRTDRETRTYRIDYPNYVRAGETEFQLSGSIAAGAGVALEDDESDDEDEEISRALVKTTRTMDFWTELQQALEAIVLGAPESDDAGATSTAAGEADEAASAGAARVGPAGDPLLPPRRVIVSRNASLVTVTAETAILAEVERYLTAVARSTERQVLIDARILEITLEEDFDWGLDIEYAPSLGTSTAGAITRTIPVGGRASTIFQDLAPVFAAGAGSFSFGITRDDLSVVLRALATTRDVRVVSTPRITTLNNHKALIKVVRNEVFFLAETEADVIENVGRVVTVEFKPQVIPIGVTLDVTPQISHDELITMHIHPSVSEIVSVVDQPQGDPDLLDAPTGSLPIIDLRETDTVLRVEDGATIVIGGLIQSREFTREEKTPLLGEIPILGQLFRGTHKEEKRTELVILLTPTVLDAPRIVHVTAETERDIAEMEALHDKRSHEPPWWRRPIGQRFGKP